MSNHTGKLIMSGWLKLKWWLKFGDFGNEEYTKLPISELPAAPASDMATKRYVDGVDTYMQAPEDVIPGEQSMEGPGRSKMAAKVEFDVEQVREATKVIKIFTNECKKAEMAVVSLTKSQFEAKRAENTKNLRQNARNRQNVASEPPISESDSLNSPNDYDTALISCQVCGFVAHNWPSDAMQPHITPNAYHKDLYCIGTWLQDPSLAENETKTPEKGSDMAAGSPKDGKMSEEVREFVTQKLNEAGLNPNQATEDESSSEKG